MHINPRLSPAVGPDDPDVLGQAVENPVVVEPLDLVVDAARLGEWSLAPGRQLEHVEAPLVPPAALERDPFLVRGKRGALHAVGDDTCATRLDVAFGVDGDVVEVPADGSGAPRTLLPRAGSPAVVRW